MVNWLPAAALVSPSTKGEVARVISEQADSLVGLARAIHADHEPASAELRTSARLIDVLSDSGFEVRIGVGGLSTAFVASRGAGELHVTLCAEYGVLDASMGHRAGRHLVAGAAIGAALGLAPFCGESGLTVSVIGTPGAGLFDLEVPPTVRPVSGKTELLASGAFDDAHAAFMLLPTPSFTGVGQTSDPLLRRAVTRNLRALGLHPSPSTRLAESGDLADVAARTPVLALMVAIGATIARGTAAFAAQSDTRAAYRAMLGGAVVLAWTALDAACDAELRSHLLAVHAVIP